jgi:hypothetical protein
VRTSNLAVDILSSPNMLCCVIAIFGMLNALTPENAIDRIRVSEWRESMVLVARRNLNGRLFHLLLNYFYRRKINIDLDLILVTEWAT